MREGGFGRRSPRALFAQLGAFGLTVVGATLLGCTRTDAPIRPVVPSRTEVAPAPEASPAIDEPPREAIARGEPIGGDDVLFEPTERTLARFQRALVALARGRRQEHVRILWLGDSHGQADFWSGRLRSRLAAIFGEGGPGFVHVGYKNYRHDDVALDVQGKWRMRPKRPVSTRRQDDGAYGLGGLRFSGIARGPRATLTLTRPSPSGRWVYDVCHRFGTDADALALELGAGLAPPSGEERARIVVHSTATTTGSVEHLRVESTSAALEIVPSGETALCGVVAEVPEESSPGIVVDTLGINGARLATALAWDADAWVAEVARRNPSLVVVEYGTNEAGDPKPPVTDVDRQVGELLARVRAASPDADCVVLSPTDRSDAENGAEAMHDAMERAAAAHGCAWFDTWSILGGRGAMKTLAAPPEPHAQRDGVHLTIRGYRALGDRLFEQLTRGLPIEQLLRAPKRNTPMGMQ
jgi:lysophospholipase L1-like esterase